MDEVWKITKDKERARHLFQMAKERFEDINKETKTYKTVEEYYEIIKELLTSAMYLDGFKTLSHKKLIEYFKENYDLLNDSQLKLVDVLRKFRNEIVYYGKKISEEFLINNRDEINEIVSVLFNIVEKKLKRWGQMR